MRLVGGQEQRWSVRPDLARKRILLKVNGGLTFSLTKAEGRSLIRSLLAADEQLVASDLGVDIGQLRAITRANAE